MKKKINTSTQPSAAAAPDQRDQVIAALQQDQGPAVLTVAVNIVTGRTSITGIMRSEIEMRAVQAALVQAQAHVQQRLEAAAEERGKQAAQEPKE